MKKILAWYTNELKTERIEKCTCINRSHYQPFGLQTSIIEAGICALNLRLRTVPKAIGATEPCYLVVSPTQKGTKGIEKINKLTKGAACDL
ncbi:hypothetical protein Trydic_g1339 [Trypoxylus dichotomus]